MRTRRPSHDTRLAAWGIVRACPASLGVVAGVFLSVALGGGAAFAELTVTELRCEYGVDPLGIDAAQPRLFWQVKSPERGERQTWYRVIVASDPALLDDDRGDLWDSGKVRSSQTTQVAYEGEPLCSSQQVFWKVRAWDVQGEPCPWSETATWTMGVLRPEDWQGRWIVAPWVSESLLVRKEFQSRSGLKRALIHICGLGQHELSINGSKVSENLLSPGWSKYNRTCLYETQDVTGLLQPGENAVGVVLGDGMYHTERRNRFSKFQGTFGPKRLIAQLELEYVDGTREMIATDETWKVDRGPVTYNDIYGGEDYDARLFAPGWDKPGFDDSSWVHAVELVRPSGVLRGYCYSAPPLREIEVFEPVSTTPLSETRDIIDFGQNASYMPRITVEGPAGSTVRLKHAEVLNEDGQINRRTCGGNRGPAYWQYTKASDEPETWFPRFFYAGCRYLQVDKIPAQGGGPLPTLTQCDGVVVHSSAEPVGDFECSNDLLNRIRELVRWAQRSNMVSVLTDCPHREKLGWLEQYHLNGPAIRYEFDVTRIFNKSMRDMADSQLANGLVPNIAPEYTEFPGTFRAAAEWGASVILVPWQQYLFCGDRRLIGEYYPTMQKYVGYLSSIATDHIVSEGLGDWYDIGPGGRPGAAKLTLPPVTATAYYYYDAKIMAEIAALLGRSEDAEGYTRLADDIRETWIREFRNADGTYGSNSQCINALALQMGLAEEADREKVLGELIQDIRGRGNAVTAGDVGFRSVLQALARCDASDVVYDMVTQDEKPGYAYQLRQGATALTEAWDANHFASHNHFMLGQVTEWFYKDLVGIEIDPAEPGFKNIIVRPNPVGGIDWAEASYKSLHGPITVRWERKAKRLTLDVSIPANTTAVVHVPSADGTQVTEGGRNSAMGDGVVEAVRSGDTVVCHIESGSYHFESEVPE